MYREDVRLEGLVFLNLNGKETEEEMSMIGNSGFFVEGEIEYKSLKANVDTERMRVKAIGVGARYLNGFLGDFDVLYFFGMNGSGKNGMKDYDGGEMMAVQLRDLIDFRTFDGRNE